VKTKISSQPSLKCIVVCYHYHRHQRCIIKKIYNNTTTLLQKQPEQQGCSVRATSCSGTLYIDAPHPSHALQNIREDDDRIFHNVSKCCPYNPLALCIQQSHLALLPRPPKFLKDPAAGREGQVRPGAGVVELVVKTACAAAPVGRRALRAAVKLHTGGRS